MLNHERFYFCKTVIGNHLRSDSWLRANNKVIHGLPGVRKLVND